MDLYPKLAVDKKAKADQGTDSLAGEFDILLLEEGDCIHREVFVNSMLQAACIRSERRQFRPSTCRQPILDLTSIGVASKAQLDLVQTIDLAGQGTTPRA